MCYMEKKTNGFKSISSWKDSYHSLMTKTIRRCSSDHRAQGNIIAIILTFQLIWLEHPLVDVMVYGLHGTHVYQETRIHVDKRYVVAKCHAKLQSYTSTSVDMWEAPLKG